MKTLVLKELRENVRIAALGLIIHTLMLVAQYRDYVWSPSNMSQPLADRDIMWSTAWFCGVFGLVLGWLQVHNERRPDLWAFLIHRPMARTEIFLGKVVGGLVLYVLVTGLPLLGFILWARWPGHVAAPFELGMLRPVVAYVLAGLLYYFAGMLADLRQARWYASRVLGVGVAIVVSILTTISPELWQTILLILIGLVILTTAVWGGFQSDGHFRHQPAGGKVALTTAIMVGCQMVAFVGAALVANFVSRGQHPGTSTTYAMTTNGTIIKWTQSASGPVGITDLEGKPLLDETTGKPIEASSFYRHLNAAIVVDVPQDNLADEVPWIQRDLSRVNAWQATPDTLWYYWNRYGRLVGYDVLTRRCIGSLGPKGFAADLAGGGDRFTRRERSFGNRSLSTAMTLFLVDLEKRSTSPLFTTTADDPILAHADVSRDDYGWQAMIVVTKHLVHLLAPDGKPIWQTPYERARASHTIFSVFRLQPPGQFALWIAPGGPRFGAESIQHPGHVVWLNQQQGVIKSLDLSALPGPQIRFGQEEKIASCVMPPPLLLSLSIVPMGPWSAGVPQEALWLSWGCAILVSLPIGLWLGRRYQFSLAAQGGWGLFLVLFGLPGLLAFLSVQEWPAREACPTCKRLRRVDRPECPHCGSPFAAPEKTGTEVFEASDYNRLFPARADGDNAQLGAA